LSQFHVRKVAVLGAGVMGAQIAAHLTNAKVPVVLFDLPAKDGDRNGIVTKAIDNLTKLSPAPLGHKSLAAQITPANFEDHLALLKDCDLIIEAVAERMEIKHGLYAKIAPFINKNAVFATNTSGLSITSLSEGFDDELKTRFCGVHFFNPPRYMYLVELIPTSATAPHILDQLEVFLTSTLGKGVVRAKDTPNFVANRIGVFSMLATMHHTQAFKLGFDEVDALTGPLIGRPKSATYRTADVVGLDTMANVIRTMDSKLPDDPWHKYYQAPAVLSALIEKGALGQKTKAGFFKKVGDKIMVLDPAKADYRLSDAEASIDAESALRQKGWAGKLKALRESDDNQAQFVWACFRDVFHYAAYHLEAIADNARDLDFAIRWGFGWDTGIFETWQQAGWKDIVSWIEADIAAGKAMCNAPLPAWVKDGRDGVHDKVGSYAPAAKLMRPRSTLEVYRKQYFPDPIYTEDFSANSGTTVWENEGLRAWTQGEGELGDGVLIVSFKSKGNTIGGKVLEGMHKAIALAEAKYKALVIWQLKEPHSYGADLSDAVPAMAAGKIDEFEAMVKVFQDTSMRIKYAAVPVVSAVRGMCFGGGCEFQMHSATTVAALESYIGLVEAGVGLLPGGGGCKEFALRAANSAVDGDVFSQLKQVFQSLAMASVSASALDAKELRLMRQSDTVVFNTFELLFVAKQVALGLANAGYRAPLPAKGIAVAGDVGIATFKASLINMLEGHYASPHDMEVATRIATALCGGEIERGSLVDETWLLNTERKNFIALALQRKTQERIAHTLNTGKPLRN
jgi:3-hydroxyacyl-CoA dehydrogenase